jgi:hypothetical protein
VHYYDRRVRLGGDWQKIPDALRHRVRVADGRKLSPSAAIADGQDVITTKTGLRATKRARK